MEAKESYVQKSIERLYGPSALGIGFKTRRSMIEQERSSPVREDINVKDDPKSLPQVFKHLRPEFRSQLVSKSGTNDNINSPKNSPIRSVKCKELEGPVVRQIPIQLVDEEENKNVKKSISNSSKEYSTPLKTFTLGANSSTTVVSNLNHGYNLRSNLYNKYSSVNMEKRLYSSARETLKKTQQIKQLCSDDSTHVETPNITKTAVNGTSLKLNNINGVLDNSNVNGSKDQVLNGTSHTSKELNEINNKCEGKFINGSPVKNISKENNHSINGSNKEKNNHSINGYNKENVISDNLKDLNQPDDLQTEIHHGHYFIKIAEDETSFLTKQASIIEEDINTNESKMTEDLKGRLLATVGKIRLLKSQKIKQFIGLCQKNINNTLTEEFPTTNEDLAGFWDMVSIQVDSVKNLITEWQKLKSNNYKEEQKIRETKTAPKLIAKSKPAVMTAEDKRKAEERRKLQEARRKALKEAMMAKKKAAKENGDVVIFAGGKN